MRRSPRSSPCPEGRTSIGWAPAQDKYGTEVIKIKFSAKHCGACVSRARCIRSDKKCQRRTLSIRTKAAYLAWQAARQRARTDEFAATYAKRAGIEAPCRGGSGAAGCGGPATSGWRGRISGMS